MSELDEAWELGLAQAAERARAAGRTDISDYLALRRSNDLLRKISSEWLLTAFTVAAGEANRRGNAIETSSFQAQRFQVGHAFMVGPRLELSRGVRRLVVEVGWPRTPRDGFIRGGGLACAKIKHVGLKRADDELRLVLDAQGNPRWQIKTKPDQAKEFHEAHVKAHLRFLISDT